MRYHEAGFTMSEKYVKEREITTTPLNRSETPEVEQEERSIWQDPSIPLGDAPPLPRWPLGLFALAWIGWITFEIMLLTKAVHP